MVLISSTQNDYSTSKVIKWLCHYGQAFQRINKETALQLNRLLMQHQSKTQIGVDGTPLRLEAIKSYWYRRGGHLTFSFKEEDALSVDKSMESFFKMTAKQELKIVSEYVERLLSNKKTLGDVKFKSINKLYALEQARQCGLTTPNTLITNNKKDLLDFLKKNEKVIIKAIYEMPLMKNEDFFIKGYSSLLDQQIVDQLEDHFFPSLLQSYIEKKYEIRIFYLDGRCYANAVFSQAKQRTSVDSRNQLMAQANRRVPYNLPDGLVKKLKVFSKKIDLNCSSIDMIYTPDKEYIFLEANPVGQFGMTSYLGNYRLEQKIAKYLIDA